MSKLVYVDLLDYRVCTENVGWSDWCHCGEVAGKICSGGKVEAIELNYKGPGKIEFQCHIEDIGWASPSEGLLLGTPGSHKRLEGFKLKISNGNGHQLFYRSFVQDFGWQNWSKDFEPTGTEGRSMRMEAIEIRVVQGGANPTIRYVGHCQDIGWMKEVGMDEECGTTGQSRRLEAIKIHYEGVGRLGVQGHLQDHGWVKEVFNDELCGTTGQSRRLEAVRLRLYDAPGYAVYSSAHVQNIGWMPYVKGPNECGTTGKSLRMEAIKIKIVRE